MTGAAEASLGRDLDANYKVWLELAKISERSCRGLCLVVGLVGQYRLRKKKDAYLFSE